MGLFSLYGLVQQGVGDYFRQKMISDTWTILPQHRQKHFPGRIEEMLFSVKYHYFEAGHFLQRLPFLNFLQHLPAFFPISQSFRGLT